MDDKCRDYGVTGYYVPKSYLAMYDPPDRARSGGRCTFRL